MKTKRVYVINSLTYPCTHAYNFLGAEDKATPTYNLGVRALIELIRKTLGSKNMLSIARSRKEGEVTIREFDIEAPKSDKVFSSLLKYEKETNRLYIEIEDKEDNTDTVEQGFVFKLVEPCKTSNYSVTFTHPAFMGTFGNKKVVLRSLRTPDKDEAVKILADLSKLVSDSTKWRRDTQRESELWAHKTAIKIFYGCMYSGRQNLKHKYVD